MPPARPTPLRLTGVRLVSEDRTILAPLDWQVGYGERWIVLGANGSGKTTLIQIAGLYLHPSSGTVEVLGETLGRCDVRAVRQRIGFASAALADQLRPQLSALDAVMTARYAALEPWWHRYDDEDRERARACLARFGVEHYAGRTLGTLSSGEQQRVLLARSLMTDPGIVLLDEPSARLDLGGRESLVQALGSFVADPASPPLVLVTHHVDEVPPGMTHAMLLRDGHALAAGPIDEVLTSEALSDCFGLPLELDRRADGRLSAWAR
jgi:iron complex transport system ATP-binding protein